ncbi:uncharacterized protein DUF1217 [Rhizobium sp. BK376]|nr:uncharacterized protein DUF1217 [Rhizobium sp. BK376]
MLSTYLGYSIVNRDIPAALDRVAAQPATKREIDYYNANIGKVKTVDDFMGDYRLYNYAVQAYGLDDVGYAKAFIKKVLESDLSDDNSFANRMSDQRYKDFAAAFNFGGNGTADVQSEAQEDELIGLYKHSFADEETSAKTEADYWNANIGKVKNVSGLLNDSRMRDFMLKATDIDPTYVSKDFLKSVLTSDPNDPNSVANQSGIAGFKTLAGLFDFKADGTLSGDTAQTADQASKLVEAYHLTVPSYVTETAAKYNKAYYESKIGSITTVSQLTGDPRLFAYIKSAFNMPATLSATSAESVFKSNLDDPKSVANILGLASAVKKFNFNQGGTLPSGTPAQSDEQIKLTSKDYLANYSSSHDLDVTNAANNFINRTTSGIKTIDDFFLSNKDDKSPLNDKQPELYEVALRAYGIELDTITKSDLRKVLTSDPYDPKSYVNSLKDDRLVKLAKAFNFDSDGKITTPLEALSQNQISKYASDYKKQKTVLLTGAQLTAAKKTVQDDTDYFKETMSKVKTASDFLADKKLVSFVLTAEGLDPKTYEKDKDFLKKAFAADPDDAKSILNKPENAKIKDIVVSFNFDTKGNLTRDTSGVAQSEIGLKQLNATFLRQTLENQEGETSDGVRLALYFERKASGVTSMFDLMGDKALFQVITTTFNLPSGISNMDVDKQAEALKQFIDIKDLQNPKKVDSLLKRFTAMYDQQNGTANSPSLSILTGGGAVGINADTLLSIAQLRSR